MYATRPSLESTSTTCSAHAHAISAGHQRGQQHEADADDEEDTEHGEEGHGGGAGVHVRSFLAPQVLLVVTKAGDVRVIGLPGGRPSGRAPRSARAPRAPGNLGLPQDRNERRGPAPRGAVREPRVVGGAPQSTGTAALGDAPSV